jgi:hypothetical protein
MTIMKNGEEQELDTPNSSSEDVSMVSLDAEEEEEEEGEEGSRQRWASTLANRSTAI